MPDREIVWAGEIEQIQTKSGVATFFFGDLQSVLFVFRIPVLESNDSRKA